MQLKHSCFPKREPHSKLFGERNQSKNTKTNQIEKQKQPTPPTQTNKKTEQRENKEKTKKKKTKKQKNRIKPKKQKKTKKLKVCKDDVHGTPALALYCLRPLRAPARLSALRWKNLWVFFLGEKNKWKKSGFSRGLLGGLVFFNGFEGGLVVFFGDFRRLFGVF